MSRDIIKRYSNGEITVVWQPSLCVHSGDLRARAAEGVRSAPAAMGDSGRLRHGDDRRPSRAMPVGALSIERVTPRRNSSRVRRYRPRILRRAGAATNRASIKNAISLIGQSSRVKSRHSVCCFRQAVERYARPDSHRPSQRTHSNAACRAVAGDGLRAGPHLSDQAGSRPSRPPALARIRAADHAHLRLKDRVISALFASTACR